MALPVSVYMCMFVCVRVCALGYIVYHTYIDNSVWFSQQVFASIAKGFQQNKKNGQQIKNSLKNTLNTFSFHVGAHNRQI